MTAAPPGIDRTRDDRTGDQAELAVLRYRGSRELVAQASAGEELAALLADARLHLLDGNEHDPFIRDAGSVVELLLAFVDGRPLPTTTSAELPAPTLTPREREVLHLLASGATNDAIAAELAIAVKTVERHVTNLYRKLDARGRADATRAAIVLGVVPTRPAT